MRPMSLTALRNNLFKIVDEVIKTGNPVELERKGHRLKIVIEDGYWGRATVNAWKLRIHAPKRHVFLA